VEHSEGKGRESVVAISRILCGSPHPCQLMKHSRDLRMVVICESLRKSSIWHVGQVLPLQGVYRFKSP
jgi:hypothetical protein